MTIYLILLFVVTWYVINGFLNLQKSFLFLKKGANKLCDDNSIVEALNNLNKKIIILMPVLRVASTPFFRHFHPACRPLRWRADRIVWGTFLGQNGCVCDYNNISGGISFPIAVRRSLVC
jgi:hypothetical protein